MADTSRVWIYHSSRPFDAEEIREINTSLKEFVGKWAAHQMPLTADAFVLYDRFVVVMVDETRNGASGCSIDASVHFLQKLALQYETDLFNRMLFAYRDHDGIHSIDRNRLKEKYQAGTINDETIFFDTLVPTKAHLEAALEKPLRESWHHRLIS